MTSARSSIATYGRSFNFASRLMPPNERSLIADAYAFCRATDDLVDEADGLSDEGLHTRLDAWLDASRAAYNGSGPAHGMLSRAMGAMRDRRVPFLYVEELVNGMRMDIGAVRYQDFGALSVYTQRVAGVVGLWMAALFGVHEPWMLERAAGLGHAMQLTNIIRDVGDDWAIGRLYLPQSLLRSYGVSEEDIALMHARRRPISPAFRAAMEAMMTVADASYHRAFEAMPDLPPAFRRTVAVAAEVYRGIHGEVRRAGYDTLTRRATTTFAQKVALGAHGLHRLSGATRERTRAAALVDSA